MNRKAPSFLAAAAAVITLSLQPAPAADTNYGQVAMHVAYML